MENYTIEATTGFTGLSVPVKATVATEDALNVVAKKAFEIYKTKVSANPRLDKYKLRLVICQNETDENGVFHTVLKIYKDYRLIDGKIELVYEMHKQNGNWRVVFDK